MDNNIYKNSIIVIGPVGVGKSLVSRRLGEVNRMPVIMTDLLKHCPKDLGKIYLRKNDISKQITDYEDEIKYNPKCDIYRTEHKINTLKNEMWTLDKQIEMRLLMPNVRNFDEMGFNGHVSDYVRQNFGETAWHFYRKQFEIKLLEDIFNNMKEPFILDMGGGLPICLDEENKKLDEKFRSLNAEIYFKNFDLESIGFDKIQTLLKPFKNVIELELPQDYKQLNTRACTYDFNDVMIKSNQYKTLATKSINVGMLVKDNKVNDRALDSIVKVINKHVQSEELEM